MNLGESIRSTTVLAIVRDGMIAMASDGQVTVGDAVIKQTAQKNPKGRHARCLDRVCGWRG